jgi:N-hydroxyarylamine O-acetyltransferase
MNDIETDLARHVAPYLELLGVDAVGRVPDLELLAELQRNHLIAVPFENLDVYHRRPVRTDVTWSIPKITSDGRGGWCFELNGAFGWLLRQLDFHVDYVSCRVNDDGGWGPELDHCALVVHRGDMRWFVDVGFGDCCMVPIPLVAGEHPGIPRDVRCRIDGDEFVLADRAPDGGWDDQLRINVTPRSLADFTPRSDHLRTAPGLAWTEKPFATRATDTNGSRVTLRPGVLRLREHAGEFHDQSFVDDQWGELLTTHFQIDDQPLTVVTGGRHS